MANDNSITNNPSISVTAPQVDKLDLNQVKGSVCKVVAGIALAILAGVGIGGLAGLGAFVFFPTVVLSSALILPVGVGVVAGVLSTGVSALALLALNYVVALRLSAEPKAKQDNEIQKNNSSEVGTNDVVESDSDSDFDPGDPPTPVDSDSDQDDFSTPDKYRNMDSFFNCDPLGRGPGELAQQDSASKVDINSMKGSSKMIVQLVAGIALSVLIGVTAGVLVGVGTSVFVPLVLVSSPLLLPVGAGIVAGICASGVSGLAIFAAMRVIKSLSSPPAPKDNSATNTEYWLEYFNN